eukprot:135633-Amphidinium_carterae.10
MDNFDYPMGYRMPISVSWMSFVFEPWFRYEVPGPFATYTQVQRPWCLFPPATSLHGHGVCGHTMRNNASKWIWVQHYGSGFQHLSSFVVCLPSILVSQGLGECHEMDSTLQQQYYAMCLLRKCGIRVTILKAGFRGDNTHVEAQHRKCGLEHGRAHDRGLNLLMSLGQAQHVDVLQHETLYHTCALYHMPGRCYREGLALHPTHFTSPLTGPTEQLTYFARLSPSAPWIHCTPDHTTGAVMESYRPAGADAKPVASSSTAADLYYGVTPYSAQATAFGRSQML